MASIIACGRVHSMTTELPNMAAILQKRQPWFTMYFFDIGKAVFNDSKERRTPKTTLLSLSPAILLCNHSEENIVRKPKLIPGATFLHVKQMNLLG